MGPAGDAANHFRLARIEALKGLGSLLDQRIDSLSRGAEFQTVSLAATG